VQIGEIVGYNVERDKIFLIFTGRQEKFKPIIKEGQKKTVFFNMINLDKNRTPSIK